MNFGGKRGQRFVGAQSVIAGLAVAVLDALHEARLPDLDIFVEVAAGDGEELDALEQGIGRILRLFKHPPIELHPGLVASVEQLCFVVLTIESSLIP